jgi:hypothetical protein
MWLERFGTVNQNIFFGFCAVVFVILILVITCLVVKYCRCDRSPILYVGFQKFFHSSALLREVAACIMKSSSVGPRGALSIEMWVRQRLCVVRSVIGQYTWRDIRNVQCFLMPLTHCDPIIPRSRPRRM